jgi:hypothetical protein
MTADARSRHGPTGIGLEHLLLSDGAADAVVLSFDDHEDGIVLDYPRLFRRVK